MDGIGSVHFILLVRYLRKATNRVSNHCWIFYHYVSSYFVSQGRCNNQKWDWPVRPSFGRPQKTFGAMECAHCQTERGRDTLTPMALSFFLSPSCVFGASDKRHPVGRWEIIIGRSGGRFFFCINLFCVTAHPNEGRRRQRERCAMESGALSQSDILFPLCSEAPSVRSAVTGLSETN